MAEPRTDGLRSPGDGPAAGARPLAVRDPVTAQILGLPSAAVRTPALGFLARVPAGALGLVIVLHGLTLGLSYTVNGLNGGRVCAGDGRWGAGRRSGHRPVGPTGPDPRRHRGGRGDDVRTGRPAGRQWSCCPGGPGGGHGPGPATACRVRPGDLERAPGAGGSQPDALPGCLAAGDHLHSRTLDGGDLGDGARDGRGPAPGGWSSGDGDPEPVPGDRVDPRRRRSPSGSRSGFSRSLWYAVRPSSMHPT
jgi:hypothetical protein